MTYSRKIWQAWEDEYLRKYYPIRLSSVLAYHLKCSTYSVYARAKRLKLKKTQAFLNKECRTLNEESGRKYRFKKGHKPWNKGKKGVITGGMQTQFKKGCLPHNTKYNGHTRVDRDGYILIRTAKGKYQHLHRINYEKAYGRIPKGRVVKFKDSNKLNCEPENLEVISKAENMRRNTIHQYPEEVKSTIRTLSKLKKTIRKHEKQD